MALDDVQPGLGPARQPVTVIWDDGRLPDAVKMVAAAYEEDTPDECQRCEDRFADVVPGELLRRLLARQNNGHSLIVGEIDASTGRDR